MNSDFRGLFNPAFNPAAFRVFIFYGLDSDDFASALLALQHFVFKGYGTHLVAQKNPLPFADTQEDLFGERADAGRLWVMEEPTDSFLKTYLEVGGQAHPPLILLSSKLRAASKLLVWGKSTKDVLTISCYDALNLPTQRPLLNNMTARAGLSFDEAILRDLATQPLRYVIDVFAQLNLLMWDGGAAVGADTLTSLALSHDDTTSFVERYVQVMEGKHVALAIDDEDMIAALRGAQRLMVSLIELACGKAQNKSMSDLIKRLIYPLNFKLHDRVLKIMGQHPASVFQGKLLAFLHLEQAIKEGHGEKDVLLFEAQLKRVLISQAL